MVSPATWWRYLVQKFDHSISIGLKVSASDAKLYPFMCSPIESLY
ncbi:unnamed protein product [Rhodiola kirilowii]